jgi:hypothetical protein
MKQYKVNNCLYGSPFLKEFVFNNLCKEINNKCGREENIFNLYKKGYSYQIIGKYFKISRQRVWQIIKRSNYIYSIKRRYTKDGNGNFYYLTESEIFVLGKLAILGFRVKPMPFNHYFDILIDNKHKIEVKHQKNAQNTKYGYYYYKYSNISSKKPVDFYIFVCGKLKQALFYIVPANKIKDGLTISVKPTHRNTILFQRNYLNAWHLLE